MILRTLALAAIALSSAAAKQFELYLNGVGPVVLETEVALDGKAAIFTGSARNASGTPIQRAEWCVHAPGAKKCSFSFWVNDWAPDATAKFEAKGRAARGFPDHEVSFESVQLSPEVAARRAAKPPESSSSQSRSEAGPTPAPTPSAPVPPAPVPPASAPPAPAPPVPAIAETHTTPLPAAPQIPVRETTATKETTASKESSTQQEEAAELEAAQQWARKVLAARTIQAEAEDVEAQKWLGSAYLTEYGAAANPAEAARWLQRASNQDDAQAEYALATLYAGGQGVERSDAKAVLLFELAATQGLRDAQFLLANFLYDGSGIPQDFGKAHMWANLAASQGVAGAAELRDRIAARLSPDQLVAVQKLASAWEPRRGAPKTRNNLLHVVSSASGFAISPDGWILTGTRAIEGCERIEIVEGGARIPALVQESSAKDGLALLKADRIFPQPARIRNSGPRPGEPVWAAGFALNDVLHSFTLHSLTWTLAGSEPGFAIPSGAAGGPIVAADGTVAGLIASAAVPSHSYLPADVSRPETTSSVPAPVLRRFLESHQIRYRSAAVATQTTDVRRLARGFSVLLECSAK